MCKFSQIKQVIGDPAHDMPGFRIIEKAEGLLLDVLEQLLPHVCLNIDAKLVPPVINDELKEGADNVQQQQPDAYADDHVPVSAWEQGIYEPLDRERECELQQSDNDGTAEINDEKPSMRPVIGKKSSYHNMFSFNIFK